MPFLAPTILRQRSFGRGRLDVQMSLRLEGAEVKAVDLAKTASLYNEKLGLPVLHKDDNSLLVELIPQTHIKFVACDEQDFEKGTVSVRVYLRTSV